MQKFYKRFISILVLALFIINNSACNWVLPTTPRESATNSKIAFSTFNGLDKTEKVSRESARKPFMEDILPLKETAMRTEELETASSKMILDENDMRIRPLIAYDKQRLIMQRWDPATGYIDQLLLYEKGKTDLTRIFVREKKFDSIQPTRPNLKDVMDEIYRFYVVQENGQKLTFRYNLKMATLLNVDKEGVTATERNEKYTASEDKQNTKFPWIVKDKENNTVFHISCLPILKEGDKLLLLRVDEQHYLWNGKTLYQIPDKINQLRVLDVDITRDDTMYAYLGEQHSFGISPKLDTERIIIIDVEGIT